MSHESQPEQDKPHIKQVWEEMESAGFSDEDWYYVHSGLLPREVNRLRTEGDKFQSPQEWAIELEIAENRERCYYQELTELHGYPDTSAMSWRDGHQARLQHLMRKYPNANWSLLMSKQFQSENRIPAKRVPVPVTVQRLAQFEQQYLSAVRQMRELETYGNDGEVVQRFFSVSLGTTSRYLERAGVNLDDLLEKNKEYCDPVPLTAENVLLIQERLEELNPRVESMESREVEDPDENRVSILRVVQQVASTYRKALEGFGLPLAERGDSSQEDPDSSVDNLTEEAVGEQPKATQDVPVAIPPDVPATLPDSSPAVDIKTTGLLTAHEASQILGIAYTTMLSELKAERFPFAHRVGRSWRISSKALTEWLEGNRDDVQTMKNPERVRTARVKKPPVPVYIKPDGRVLSF